MQAFKYTPDSDLKVHEEGAINLICKPFRSHESGLPEWIKNSSDAYCHEDIGEERRVIVVIFDRGAKEREASISCLDLCGMTSAIIENNFRHWADPDAAKRNSKGIGVQGGHGNGGKCYMTQMFESGSWVISVREKRRIWYGVGGKTIRFGYIPNPQLGRDIPSPDILGELKGALSYIGCTLASLPTPVTAALQEAPGFTLVSGFKPKGYDKGIPTAALVKSLQQHVQMIQTFELCRIYLVVNGIPYNHGKPLSLIAIDPMAEAAAPRIINIPETLKDPETDQVISTITDGRTPPGHLVLRTSEKSMRWTLKYRHSIIFRATSGLVGYVEVPELGVTSSYSDHIYGECRLDSLEEYKLNDRHYLAESPLTRAVLSFLTSQVEKYAREFESRAEKKLSMEERSEVSKISEALNRWKDRFLGKLMQGLFGTGPGPGRGEGQDRLPKGKPARLELSTTYQKAGVGVAFRPRLRFFDQDGKQVQSVPYRWVSEDTNVAMVDEDLLVINTYTHGKTFLYAETIGQPHIVSNRVPLEVVHIHNITLSPLSIEVPRGGRMALTASCHLDNGQDTADICLEWTEDDTSIVRVSASGMVYGFQMGETYVTAGDDRCMANHSVKVTVVEADDSGSGKKSGRGFPRILVSGYHVDPDTGEDRNFKMDDPPVAQAPRDVERNIWWINSSAPLARLYLDRAHGYGHDSLAFRMYFLERFVDALVQIALSAGPHDLEMVNLLDWSYKSGYEEAKIQAAIADELAAFISTGVLPGA